ncbi:acyltransferase family protein, partial [Vibrio tubiashii]|uniref:acyltransferase family protein n=1 Tax=Vibrio tubiashii TaxID=29498 RepID=UPI00349ECF86
MNSTKLSYRPEIDGLRTIAVISVILYHAQMIFFGKDWFEGGYIGVDVFFVISGYLITRIVLIEIQSTGSFKFLAFYERRARRILPLLFVVIFVTIPYAWQKFLPSDFVEYAESVLASLFFSSNFFFYFSTTEYGADSALLKPFLHTWSLGVEEQFYIVLPVLAIVSFKYFRPHFLTVLVVMSLISLQFSELMEVRNSDLNFYLPFSRFWELAVGSILAYRELNCPVRKDCFGQKVFPVLGLYLLAYGILFFNGKTPHPSFHTMIPITGVALIIGFSNKDELVGKVLGSKPFVWIGLISYSLYLWHFPIFAFSRLGDKQLTNYDKWELIVLTFILSVVSYFFVERPFRKKIKIKQLIIFFVISFLMIVLGALYVIRAEGIATKFRLGFEPNIIQTAEPSYLFGDEGCDDTDAYYFHGTKFCSFGDKSKSEFDFLLLGDSHAMHSQPLLNKISTTHGLRGVFGGNSGCPPLLDIYPARGFPHPNDWSKRCFDFNKNGLKLVKSHNLKTVILVARWDYYVD